MAVAGLIVFTLVSALPQHPPLVLPSAAPTTLSELLLSTERSAAPLQDVVQSLPPSSLLFSPSHRPQSTRLALLPESVLLRSGGSTLEEQNGGNNDPVSLFQQRSHTVIPVQLLKDISFREEQQSQSPVVSQSILVAPSLSSYVPFSSLVDQRDNVHKPHIPLSTHESIPVQQSDRSPPLILVQGPQGFHELIQQLSPALSQVNRNSVQNNGVQQLLINQHRFGQVQQKPRALLRNTLIPAQEGNSFQDNRKFLLVSNSNTLNGGDFELITQQTSPQLNTRTQQISSSPFQFTLRELGQNVAPVAERTTVTHTVFVPVHAEDILDHSQNNKESFNSFPQTVTDDKFLEEKSIFSQQSNFVILPNIHVHQNDTVNETKNIDFIPEDISELTELTSLPSGQSHVLNTKIVSNESEMLANTKHNFEDSISINNDLIKSVTEQTTRDEFGNQHLSVINQNKEILNVSSIEKNTLLDEVTEDPVTEVDILPNFLDTLQTLNTATEIFMVKELSISGEMLGDSKVLVTNESLPTMAESVVKPESFTTIQPHLNVKPSIVETSDTDLITQNTSDVLETTSNPIHGKLFPKPSENGNTAQTHKSIGVSAETLLKEDDKFNIIEKTDINNIDTVTTLFENIPSTTSKTLTEDSISLTVNLHNDILPEEERTFDINVSESHQEVSSPFDFYSDLEVATDDASTQYDYYYLDPTDEVDFSANDTNITFPETSNLENKVSTEEQLTSINLSTESEVELQITTENVNFDATTPFDRVEEEDATTLPSDSVISISSTVTEVNQKESFTHNRNTLPSNLKIASALLNESNSQSFPTFTIVVNPNTGRIFKRATTIMPPTEIASVMSRIFEEREKKIRDSNDRRFFRRRGLFTIFNEERNVNRRVSNSGITETKEPVISVDDKPEQTQNGSQQNRISLRKNRLTAIRNEQRKNINIPLSRSLSDRNDVSPLLNFAHNDSSLVKLTSQGSPNLMNNDTNNISLKMGKSQTEINIANSAETKKLSLQDQIKNLLSNRSTKDRVRERLLASRRTSLSNAKSTNVTNTNSKTDHQLTAANKLETRPLRFNKFRSKVQSRQDMTKDRTRRLNIRFGNLNIINTEKRRLPNIAKTRHEGFARRNQNIHESLRSVIDILNSTTVPTWQLNTEIITESSTEDVTLTPDAITFVNDSIFMPTTSETIQETTISDVSETTTSPYKLLQLTSPTVTTFIETVTESLSTQKNVEEIQLAETEKIINLNDETTLQPQIPEFPLDLNSFQGAHDDKIMLTFDKSGIAVTQSSSETTAREVVTELQHVFDESTDINESFFNIPQIPLTQESMGRENSAEHSLTKNFSKLMTDFITARKVHTETTDFDKIGFTNESELSNKMLTNISKSPDHRMKMNTHVPNDIMNLKEEHYNIQIEMPLNQRDNIQNSSSTDALIKNVETRSQTLQRDLLDLNITRGFPIRSFTSEISKRTDGFRPRIDKSIHLSPISESAIQIPTTENFTFSPQIGSFTDQETSTKSNPQSERFFVKESKSQDIMSGNVLLQREHLNQELLRGRFSLLIEGSLLEKVILERNKNVHSRNNSSGLRLFDIPVMMNLAHNQLRRQQHIDQADLNNDVIIRNLSSTVTQVASARQPEVETSSLFKTIHSPQMECDKSANDSFDTDSQLQFDASQLSTETDVLQEIRAGKAVGDNLLSTFNTNDFKENFETANHTNLIEMSTFEGSVNQGFKRPHVPTKIPNFRELFPLITKDVAFSTKNEDNPNFTFGLTQQERETITEGFEFSFPTSTFSPLNENLTLSQFDPNSINQFEREGKLFREQDESLSNDDKRSSILDTILVLTNVDSNGSTVINTEPLLNDTEISTISNFLNPEKDISQIDIQANFTTEASFETAIGEKNVSTDHLLLHGRRPISHFKNDGITNSVAIESEIITGIFATDKDSLHQNQDNVFRFIETPELIKKNEALPENNSFQMQLSLHTETSGMLTKFLDDPEENEDIVVKAIDLSSKNDFSTSAKEINHTSGKETILEETTNTEIEDKKEFDQVPSQMNQFVNKAHMLSDTHDAQVVFSDLSAPIVTVSETDAIARDLQLETALIPEQKILENSKKMHNIVNEDIGLFTEEKTPSALHSPVDEIDLEQNSNVNIESDSESKLIRTQDEGIVKVTEISQFPGGADVKLFPLEMPENVQSESDSRLINNQTTIIVKPLKSHTVNQSATSLDIHNVTIKLDSSIDDSDTESQVFVNNDIVDNSPPINGVSITASGLHELPLMQKKVIRIKPMTFAATTPPENIRVTPFPRRLIPKPLTNVLLNTGVVQTLNTSVSNENNDIASMSQFNAEQPVVIKQTINIHPASQILINKNSHLSPDEADTTQHEPIISTQSEFILQSMQNHSKLSNNKNVDISVTRITSHNKNDNLDHEFNTGNIKSDINENKPDILSAKEITNSSLVGNKHDFTSGELLLLDIIADIVEVPPNLDTNNPVQTENKKIVSNQFFPVVQSDFSGISQNLKSVVAPIQILDENNFNVPNKEVVNTFEINPSAPERIVPQSQLHTIRELRARPPQIPSIKTPKSSGDLTPSTVDRSLKLPDSKSTDRNPRFEFSNSFPFHVFDSLVSNQPIQPRFGTSRGNKISSKDRVNPNFSFFQVFTPSQLTQRDFPLVAPDFGPLLGRPVLPRIGGPVLPPHKDDLSSLHTEQRTLSERSTTEHLRHVNPSAISSSHRAVANNPSNSPQPQKSKIISMKTKSGSLFFIPEEMVAESMNTGIGEPLNFTSIPRSRESRKSLV